MVKRENEKVKSTFKTTHMVFHTNWVISMEASLGHSWCSPIALFLPCYLQ